MVYWLKSVFLELQIHFYPHSNISFTIYTDVDIYRGIREFGPTIDVRILYS